jgi:hypothetical protein
MYHTLYDNVAPIVITRESPKKLETQVSKNELVYSKTFDSLKRQSVKLQIDLEDTKAALNTVKAKNYSLQVQVYDVLDRHFEKKQRNNSDGVNCDSLASTVEELMQTSNEKDSLYEEASINLEEQIKNRDSTIAGKDQHYQEIKEAFTQSNEGWKQVIYENKNLSKKFKKQKFKSKVLSTLLLILTGAVANYLIQN